MPGLVLQALTHPDPEARRPARCGFTVTKRVGNSVVRNRARRRLREAARLVLAEHPLTGCDIVLIGRDGTCARPFAELRADLERALRRTGARDLPRDRATASPAP